MWSLAVEEQFYLMWPIAICFLGRRRGLWACAAVIAVAPLVRMATWRFFPESLPGIKWEFQFVCDSLATGCLMAGFREWFARHDRCDKVLRSNLMLLLPLLAACMNFYCAGRRRLNFLFGQSFMNACIGLFLLHAIRHSHQWAGRVLRLRPLELLGTLIYSLYLWQQLFLNHYSKSWVCAFPVNIVLALAMAFLSYVLVESPCLNLRKKLEVRFFSPS